MAGYVSNGGRAETPAAGAEISLSRLWWQRGQNDRARVHETRAQELVGTDRSLAAARVLAFVARTRTIGGNPEEGLRLATEALEMAEALGVEELIAHSLATIGLAKVYLGDPTGEQDGGEDQRPNVGALHPTSQPTPSSPTIARPKRTKLDAP